MELYVNSSRTERYGDTYVANAITYSENGNHATVYLVSVAAEVADAKLREALREPELMPETSITLDD